MLVRANTTIERNLNLELGREYVVYALIFSKSETKFVIDCEELQMITSVGLGTLVRAKSRLRENGGALAIARASGLAAETLRIVHFDRLFSLFSDVDEAAASLG